MSGPALPLPAVVAHADWSLHPRKRWMACARLGADGRYRAAAPVPVGDCADLLERLGGGGSLLLGLDLPAGLPRAYAAAAGIDAFLPWFERLGEGAWSAFWSVAEEREQIGHRRPFYPMRPGGRRRQHLIDGLGLVDRMDLMRVCDLKTPQRGEASPLFWTMGAKQVGKAALSAWRELLQPAVREGSAALWPFHGPLGALLSGPLPVVAETYPGEIYHHLGLFQDRPRGSKQRQSDRVRQGAILLDRARGPGVALTPKLRAAVRDGFGPSKDGEDPFDATVGLIGMLNILLGGWPHHEPAEPAIRHLEGWILGQKAPE